jgi:hypothetical protein
MPIEAPPARTATAHSNSVQFKICVEKVPSCTYVAHSGGGLGIALLISRLHCQSIHFFLSSCTMTLSNDKPISAASFTRKERQKKVMHQGSAPEVAQGC